MVIIMKRPFVVIGATSLITMAVVLFLGAAFGVFIAVVALLFTVATACFLKLKIKTSVVLVCAVVAVTAVIGVMERSVKYDKVLSFCGKECVLSGVVTELEVNETSKYFTVKTDGHSNFPKGIKVRVYCFEVPEVDEYSEVKICAELYSVEGKNAGTRLVSLVSGEGFTVKGYLKEVITAGEGRKTISGAIDKLRNEMDDGIRRMLTGYQGAMVSEMTLGIKGESGDEITEEFRISGISHLMAVSGLHLSITAGAIFIFLQSIGLGKRRCAWVVCVAALFYAVLTGWQVGAVRAAIAMITAMVGIILGYESEPLNTLGIAVFIIVMTDPTAVFSVSFYLSFAATLGILLCTGKFTSGIVKATNKLPFRKVRTVIAGSFSTTVSALLFTLPITVIVFENVPIYSIFTNMLSAPFAPLILIFGLLAEVLSLCNVLGFLAKMCGFIAGISATALRGIAGFFAGLPYAQTYVGYGYVKIWVVAFATVFLVLILAKKKADYFRYAALLGVIVLMVGTVSYEISVSGATKVTVSGFDSSVGIIVKSGGNEFAIAKAENTRDVYLLVRELKGESADGSLVITDGRGITSKAVERAKFKNIILKRELCEDEKIVSEVGEAEIIVLTDKMELTLGAIKAKEVLNGVWSIESNEIKMLYISEKCDILDIDVNYTDADIVVLDGVKPQNADRLRCEYAIYYEVYGEELITSKNILLGCEDSTEFYLKDGAVKRIAGGFYDIFE